MPDALTPAPLHPSAQGPEDGRAYWLRAADGVRLRVGVWGAEGAGGTVLLFPGRTECVEKYGRTAAELRARGLATVAIDWRGQGMADRLIGDVRPGHVGRFADYQLDVAAVLDLARALDLPQPWHLLAHSMGGCIGLRALMGGLPVRTAAFSAPMWGIGLSPVMRPVAWVTSTVARGLGQGHRIVPGQSDQSYLVREPFEGNTLTSDRAMWDYMKAQVEAVPALGLGGPTTQWLNESLREMRALRAMPSPRVPTLTLLGSDEAIVDPDAIRERMARWPGGDLVDLAQARHEVLMETPAIRARVIDRLARHFT